MIWLKSIFLSVILVMLAMPVQAKHYNIIYPRSTKAADPRDVFPEKLLKLALEKNGDDCTMTPSAEVLQTKLMYAEMAANKGINIIHTGMDANLEKILRPIRVPIYRGLLGYRLFIINKNRAADFAKIQTLDDLKKFTAAQGIGWQDVDIMRAAGLNVAISEYDWIFKQVEAGRVDFFPRGAPEPFGELAERKDEAKDLMVDPHVVLVYPFDMFFYTNKENEDLAQAIENGLKKAYADGSYLALFNNDEEIKKVLSEAKLNERVKISIDNPLMSPEDKHINPDYWSKGF